jgi:BON domain
MPRHSLPGLSSIVACLRASSRTHPANAQPSCDPEPKSGRQVWQGPRLDCAEIPSSIYKKSPPTTESPHPPLVIGSSPTTKDPNLASGENSGVAGLQLTQLQVQRFWGLDRLTCDAWLAQAALTAMKWNTALPPGRVTVTVTNGQVALNGTLEWHIKRTPQRVRFETSSVSEASPTRSLSSARLGQPLA